MEIYNYHPLTGEYLGRGLADDSPLDPGNPIVPGYATPNAPPTPVGRGIAVFRTSTGSVPQNWPDGAWTSMPDYRAVPLYRTADGSRFEPGAEYSGIGDLPAFLTDEARPGPAHVWRDEAWQLDAVVEAQQLASMARAQRDDLLVEADRLIAPLMDGFVLGELLAADEARLKVLSQYRKALRTVPDQAEFPRTINWPVKPA